MILPRKSGTIRQLSGGTDERGHYRVGLRIRSISPQQPLSNCICRVEHITAPRLDDQVPTSCEQFACREKMTKPAIDGASPLRRRPAPSETGGARAVSAASRHQRTTVWIPAMTTPSEYSTVTRPIGIATRNRFTKLAGASNMSIANIAEAPAMRQKAPTTMTAPTTDTKTGSGKPANFQ